jgi:hypothetical protein
VIPIEGEDNKDGEEATTSKLDLASYPKEDLRTAVAKAMRLEREMHKLDTSCNPEVRDLMQLVHATVFRDQNVKETTKNEIYCFSAVYMSNDFDTPDSVPETLTGPKKEKWEELITKRNNEF